jgi:hypothetical protein
LPRKSISPSDVLLDEGTAFLIGHHPVPQGRKSFAGSENSARLSLRPTVGGHEERTVFAGVETISMSSSLSTKPLRS